MEQNNQYLLTEMCACSVLCVVRFYVWKGIFVFINQTSYSYWNNSNCIFFRILQNEENKILDTLSTDDDLLENDASVQLINTSKLQINELLEKISVAKVTEKQIDVTRTAYKPLAAHASIIYFTIGNEKNKIGKQTWLHMTLIPNLSNLFLNLDELMNINQMYRYSLSWFVGHLTSAIDNTDKVDDVQQRIKDLKKYFTYFIYTKLCRGLKEKV